MTTPRIIINNLSFHIEHTHVKFEAVNLTFDQQKIGIVGNNGIGKTTFLKLLNGELSPQQGSIQRYGSLMTLPQSHSVFSTETRIATALGVAAITDALARIQAGSTEQHDYDRVSGHWDIESRIAEAFNHFKLGTIDINRPFNCLSGGQKTKVLLASALIFSPDILLFDEPTNNLDSTSRDIVQQFVASCPVTLIIVSHDRALLNTLDRIIEIHHAKMTAYGGNYTFYQQQKQQQADALQREYLDTLKSAKKLKRETQQTLEKHQKLAARGNKAFRQGKVDKLTAMSKQGRSEKTHRRNTTLAKQRTHQQQQALSQVKAKLQPCAELALILDATRVANSKTVLSIKDLGFGYPQGSTRVLEQFNLTLIGPGRTAITGPNGCGKSTLIQLIRGQLIAQQGSISIGVPNVAYLDQDVTLLDPQLSLIDNYLQHNDDSTTFDGYLALAVMGFRDQDARRIAGALSGGERMRAGLAISLMSKTPPQLVILDEPTNHLDLDSVLAIEQALQAYLGALLVVSHDAMFLNNINIDNSIKLG